MVAPLLLLGTKEARREARRRKELRDILGRGGAVDRNRRLPSLRKFVTDHYRAIAIVLAAASFLMLLHIYYFNALTAAKQQVKNLRAQIEGAIQMRENIIPGLTTAVDRFIGYEGGVFLSAIKARENSLGGSRSTEDLVQALKEIKGSDFSPNDLSRFMAVAENYPTLVSSQSYQLLIAQIGDVENKIYGKRIEYNDAVNVYNTGLSTVPANLLGTIMGFCLEPYFEWDGKPEWVFPGSEAGGPSLRMESRSQEK